MAIRVSEVMNRELFCLRPQQSASEALASLLALGLSAAPVLDDKRRPVGVVSWRDLVRARDDGSAESHMTSPAIVVHESASLEDAALVLADRGVHHAPIVDDAGVAVGFVSTLDLMRALVGAPTPHPPGFSHHDFETGVVWTDELELNEKNVDAAPPNGGVLVLIHGGKNRPEKMFWAEATNDVRGRVLDVLWNRQQPLLSKWLDEGSVRFRAASVVAASERRRLASSLMARVRHERSVVGRARSSASGCTWSVRG
jgi:CBS domain-containing protein